MPDAPGPAEASEVAGPVPRRLLLPRMVPGGRGWRWLRLALRGAVAVCLVLSVAVGWLAWRLAEGPMAVPFLARELERAANPPGGGSRLEIRRAEIAWEGWRGGAAAPLDIRLSGVRVLDGGGAVRAELPDAAATLSFGALLRGHVAPATIELRRPSLLVFRAADGSLRLDLAGLDPLAPQPAEEVPASPDGGPLALLAELMRPPSDSAMHAALRRIRLNGGEITVVDAELGQSWALVDPVVDIRRPAEGGLVAEGSATLRLGTLRLAVRLNGAAEGRPDEGRPMRLSAGLALPALHPAELAAAVPLLRPLAVLDAPVSLSVAAEFDGEGRPRGGSARLAVQAGALDLGPNRRLDFTGMELAAEGSGRALRITQAQLRLPAPVPGPEAVGRRGSLGAAPGPVFSGHGEALFRAGRWETRLELSLDTLLAGELPRLWPAGLAPELRGAVTQGVPEGRLHDARVHLALSAPESLDSVALVEGRAELAAEGLVLDLGPGRRVNTAAASLAASLTPELLSLHRLNLRLPVTARAGAPPPSPTTINASGEARRAAGRWRGSLTLGLDAISFADLPGHWPPGLAAGSERDWIVENVVAGELRNGQWRIEAEAPESLASLNVTALSGTAEASEATVHWLRPMPPATGAHGTAEFSLSEITLRVRGARQQPAEGGRAGMEIREGSVRFFNLDQSPGNAEINALTTGTAPELLALLRHPRLKLFERRKLEVSATAGQVEGRVNVAFPLWADLPMELLRIRANARVAEARLVGALAGRDLERAALEIAVDTDGLRLSGTGQLTGQGLNPALASRLALEMDFRNGPANQMTERGTLTTRMDARQMATFGLETGRVLEGPVPVEARYERRRTGPALVHLRGDLRESRLALDAAGWAKPVGTPGSAEATLRLQNDQLQTIEGIRVEALELSLRGRAIMARNARLDRMEITESLFGASRFLGEVRPPPREGEPWGVRLHGPVLDLRPFLGAAGHVEGGAAAEPNRPASTATDPPLLIDARFDRVLMGEGRGLLGLVGRLRTDNQGLFREGRATGRTNDQGGAFEAVLAPQGALRHLRVQAEDGGALLRAMDLVQPVQGGRLTVRATYDELRPGAPLSGTAELEQFVVRDAPALGKILQGMTLFGLVDAVQGGSGLTFARLVAPFTLTPEALQLNDARAFSASLGVTAKGRVLRRVPVLDIEGTIVPAYMFNTLLGNLPIIGRLFSPEAGGGLFAATFRVQGPVSQPQVTMNPLAALTPGFLRGLFGILDQPAPAARGR